MLPKFVHGEENFLELLNVIYAVHIDATGLAKILEALARIRNAPLLPLLRVGSLYELVEDVKVTLTLDLVNHAGLLEKIIDGRGTADGEVLLIKVDLHPLTESRRVIVTQRLGVT